MFSCVTWHAKRFIILDFRNKCNVGCKNTNDIISWKYSSYSNMTNILSEWKLYNTTLFTIPISKIKSFTEEKLHLCQRCDLIWLYEIESGFLWELKPLMQISLLSYVKSNYLTNDMSVIRYAYRTFVQLNNKISCEAFDISTKWLVVGFVLRTTIQTISPCLL